MLLSTGTNSLLENSDALASAVARLIQPDAVSAIILEGDSMFFGNQASDIDKTTQVKFRKKLCDIKNAHFGGAAKSGAGRIAPFFPSSTIAAIDGPFILPTGSGWAKRGAGSLNTTYFIEPIRQHLYHPGGITPSSGTHYAGCYMLFNPSVAHPGAAKWVGLLLNAGLTGTFKVQGRQGASIAAAGSSGVNRFKMASGAFSGSDVPDPSSNTDLVFDITVDPATMPDYINYITGHLNSTAMDPAAVWALCIYRLTNAATTVEIGGVDAHYDEYTAQNTPRSDGATSVMSFAWPGDTDQGEQGGAASYGVNSDYNQQNTQFVHMMSHSRRYIHAKYPHKMPRAVLAISNEWRNMFVNADNISGFVTPAALASRIVQETLAYAQAGIAHLYAFDVGGCGSYICWGCYFNGGFGGSNSDDYRTALSGAVSTLRTYKGTRHVGGGLTVLDLDYAFGTGGIDGYSKASMFSPADFLHWNESGQDRVSTILAKVSSGDFSVPKAKPLAQSTRTRDSRTITQKAGVAKTTLLSIDPNDLGSMRYTASGFAIPGDDANWVSGCSFYNGTNLSALNNTVRGTSGELKWKAEAFGERAGFFFDNAANKNNKIVITLPTISETTFTLIFAMQNLWEGGMSAYPGQNGVWFDIGNATDDGLSTTTPLTGFSNGGYTIWGAPGLNGGVPYISSHSVAGQQMNLQIGDHPGSQPTPTHDPFIGIVRIDLSTRTAQSNINPNQAWKSTTMPANHASTFAPTRLSIGGILGTGANAMPMMFGGFWIVSGTVTDAEAVQIFDVLHGESGNWFQTGTGFGDFGAMQHPV